MSLAILFIITFTLGVIGLAFVLVSKKRKSLENFQSIAPKLEESILSIHDEIAKTIESIKSQPSIVEEPKKKTTKKATPVSKSKPTKTASKTNTKKTVTKKTTKK